MFLQVLQSRLETARSIAGVFAKKKYKRSMKMKYCVDHRNRIQQKISLSPLLTQNRFCKWWPFNGFGHLNAEEWCKTSSALSYHWVDLDHRWRIVWQAFVVFLRHLTRQQSFSLPAMDSGYNLFTRKESGVMQNSSNRRPINCLVQLQKPIYWTPRPIDNQWVCLILVCFVLF